MHHQEVAVLSATRVLVVDDDDFTRTLVSSLVESLGYQVVGRAATVTDAMAVAHETNPELAILDLDLGEGPTGIDLAHGLRRLSSRIAIVILTSYGDPTWMGQRRESPTGSRYVVKGEVNDPAVLADAIALSLADPHAPTASEPTSTPLNEGQWEVLRLVAAGYTNAEIARRRSITEDAVNKAITRLVRQLNIDVSKTDNSRVLLTQAFNRMTGRASERRD